jgi:hypothetical protein
VVQVKHKEVIMQPDVKSMALGVILGVLVVLALNNHLGDLIRDAVANTVPPAPMFLTEAAVLNPNW